MQENFGNFIERVMRVMTHINIGATLGLAAWLLVASWQVVTGEIRPALRLTELKALMSVAHAGPPVALHLLPAVAGAELSPPCHAAQPAPQLGDAVMSGDDL